MARAARRRRPLAAWSKISGLDLARLGTTATAEEITDTAVTQPLVVAATLLAHEELTNARPARPAPTPSSPATRSVRSPPMRSQA